MSALYSMIYDGQSGSSVGAGSVYVGRNTIVGVDVGGGRYHGSYSEDAGKIKIVATLSYPAGGMLVTGATVPPGAQLSLVAEWPLNFAGGQRLLIMVQGLPVYVKFEKIGDVP